MNAASWERREDCVSDICTLNIIDSKKKMM